MKKDELQNKARNELSALKIIGIPNVSEIRRAKELSDNPTVENTIVEITTVFDVSVKNTVVENIIEDINVDIRNNYHKLDNDVSDILAKYQTVTEQVIYGRLYRLSYGYRKNTCRVGMGTLAKACNISSPEKTVKKAIEGLIKKGHIAIANDHGNNINGTEYRVYLPCEIEGIESRTVVEITAVNNSKTVRPENTTVKNTTQLSNPENKEKADTAVKNTTVDFPPFKDSLKNTLSLSNIVDLFYKGVGQKDITKRKREKAEKDIKELIKDGFSQEDIVFTINWTRTKRLSGATLNG